MSKPEKIRIKPALSKRTGEPLIVRDPRTFRPLPADGALVSVSTYWTRSLLVGDVELVEAKKSKPKKSKAPRKRASK